MPLADALNIAELSMSNFTDWINTDPTVLEAISRSDSEHIREACQAIRKAMKGQGGLGSKDLEAARFVLTKRRRKQFGDGIQGIQAEQLMERPAEDLTAEARRSRIKALLGVDPDTAIAVEPKRIEPPATVQREMRVGRRRVATPAPLTVVDVLPFGIPPG